MSGSIAKYIIAKHQIANPYIRMESQVLPSGHTRFTKSEVSLNNDLAAFDKVNILFSWFYKL